MYKVEKYLGYCIESILNQSFDDFELILVDDGSPDKCPDICDKFAEKDIRVSVIHKENGGLSAARNSGIEVSKGKYICFVDSDDVLHRDFCKLLYHAAINSDCKIAACKMQRFKDSAVLPETIEQLDLKLNKMSYALFLKKQMGKEIELGVCNKLFHSSIFNNIRFKNNKLHEDIFFAADLLTEELKAAVYIDLPLYFYRQREESIVNFQLNNQTCSPDRVTAGRYLIKRAKDIKFEYLDECLFYAINYPWFFVDSTYVRFQFKKNKKFLLELQDMICENRKEYHSLSLIPEIIRKRMLIFSKSKLLYAFNAYARLIRVYLFHILKRDAYVDGHGI